MWIWAVCLMSFYPLHLLLGWLSWWIRGIANSTGVLILNLSGLPSLLNAWIVECKWNWSPRASRFTSESLSSPFDLNHPFISNTPQVLDEPRSVQEWSRSREFYCISWPFFLFLRCSFDTSWRNSSLLPAQRRVRLQSQRTEWKPLELLRVILLKESRKEHCCYIGLYASSCWRMMLQITITYLCAWWLFLFDLTLLVMAKKKQYNNSKIGFWCAAVRLFLYLVFNWKLLSLYV